MKIIELTRTPTGYPGGQLLHVEIDMADGRLVVERETALVPWTDGGQRLTQIGSRFWLNGNPVVSTELGEWLCTAALMEGSQ